MWKDKSCDHGNMVQLRHYWSHPYRVLADTFRNRGFWSPAKAKTKHFKFISHDLYALKFYQCHCVSSTEL